MSRFFRRLLTALLVFTAASAFCLLLYHYDNKYTQSAPQAIAGTLFVSEDDLAAYPVRSLWNGWNFYPDVLPRKPAKTAIKAPFVPCRLAHTAILLSAARNGRRMAAAPIC